VTRENRARDYGAVWGYPGGTYALGLNPLTATGADLDALAELYGVRRRNKAEADERYREQFVSAPTKRDPIVLRCPECGASVRHGVERCEYCASWLTWDAVEPLEPEPEPEPAPTPVARLEGVRAAIAGIVFLVAEVDIEIKRDPDVATVRLVGEPCFSVNSLDDLLCARQLVPLDLTTDYGATRLVGDGYLTELSHRPDGLTEVEWCGEVKLR